MSEIEAATPTPAAAANAHAAPVVDVTTAAKEHPAVGSVAHPRLMPSGDHCLIVEFGQTIALDINLHACRFADRVRAAAIRGVVDVVPMFAGVAVHYLPHHIACGPAHPLAEATGDVEEMPYDALCRQIETLLAADDRGDGIAPRIVEIPVCYGGEYGPDFDDIARTTGMSAEELIAAHSGADARVFMVGFAPGAPYLGLWDERFALPRRASPRMLVPAGTVSIANRQSVIMPLDLPTGWHLLGRTPLRLYNPDSASPFLLSPGDRVKFVPISGDAFKALAAEQSV
ncbi:5-oxoprolinase subunit PxpB [Robbsia sp. KACC 23696]|uniref:5-oxoprolinase subunit PxpB n=1 Tax=Robbsia sp. KACC 23696 TaxID=3149231 RepID=UPI00325BABF8